MSSDDGAGANIEIFILCKRSCNSDGFPSWCLIVNYTIITPKTHECKYYAKAVCIRRFRDRYEVCTRDTYRVLQGVYVESAYSKCADGAGWGVQGGNLQAKVFCYWTRNHLKRHRDQLEGSPPSLVSVGFLFPVPPPSPRPSYSPFTRSPTSSFCS